MSSYYDLDAANARIAELRPILAALRDARKAIAAGQPRLVELSRAPDTDPDLLAREQEAMTVTVQSMERAVRQIDAWGVTLRDIGSGLVDFPALVNGRPIWLCWKLGEESVVLGHYQDEACGMRRPLSAIEPGEAPIA